MNRKWRSWVSPTLAVLVLIAVVLRVAAAVYQGNVVEPLPGIYDQVSYDALARRLLAGYGFSFESLWWPMTRPGEPTAHWSYLYTLYLAGTYTVFGPHPVAARLIQAVVVGVLQPWLTYRMGRRVFGSTVGLVAAALSAGYAYFWYYGGALMTEPFYIVAILGALELAMTMREALPAARLRQWLWLGLALGVAVLLRQLFLLWAPVMLGWLVWPMARAKPADPPTGARRVWQVARGPLASLAVITILIPPWTIRNYMAFHRFVLLNTNAGYAFFWANHPIYGTHFVGILPKDGPGYQDLVPPGLRGLDEAALDQALLREGVRFVVQDPVRYALLSVSRVKEYFKFWPAADSGAVSNAARSLSFGLLLPVMAYGVLLSLWQRRALAAEGRWPAIVLLLLFMGVYTLIHLLSWALIRYRLPVDAVLVVFAGYGLVDLAARVARGVGRRAADEGARVQSA